jgi:hypothetical protein
MWERAGVEVAEHPPLRERVLERLGDPLADALEPVVGPTREENAIRRDIE